MPSERAITDPDLDPEKSSAAARAKRTRIVATLGPASRSEDLLEQLMRAGMNVARLNFSHGSHTEHRTTLAAARRVAARLGHPLAILPDLAGPKIRTGPIAAGSIELSPGARFILTSRDVPGDSQAVSLTYRKLPEDVRAGDVLLLNDGALELRVEETSLQEVVCRVVVGGRLSSSKGINLPTRSIQAPGLTARDLEDLAFGIQEGVDYVALSFVRSAEDVREVKQRIRQHGADTPVIAKIEKHEVLDHIDAILEVADGIMVARGDLGVEIPIERVPVIQKMLIARANRAGKPVIVATQMLKSMEKNPRPTRAEVADIANAVWGGADATMLSEETAVGQHPVAAVRTMAQTAWNAEQELGQQAGTDQFEPRGSLEPQEAVAHGACRLAQDLDAAAILVCTQSGSTSRLVAKHRPDRPIVAITPSPATYRRLALIWGTWPLSMSAVSQQEEMEAEALARAVQAGLLRSGQRVVLTAGIPLYVPGTTNSIKVLTVP